MQQVLRHAGREGAAAVCAIRGMGGLGKTQLALEVARQLGPSYPDAQLMLELQPGNLPLAPEAVVAAVVRAFLPDARLPDALPELQGLYCSVLAGKRGLLLLDNAADAGQVRPLLPPPAGGAVIVTARARFPLPGAYLHELGLLPGAEAEALLRRIFADSGRADLAGADLAALAGLCGRLPLALRVAAGHLTSYLDETLGEYMEALRRARLAGLQAPGEPAVAAVLGLSVGRLRREDAVLAGRWHDLAVVPAPFDREAAAAVWEADAETARAALSGLAQQCLVEYDPERRAYGLHDLLRACALAEPVAAEVVLRHAGHYLARGSAADELYRQGGEHVPEGLAAFDLAWPHLQAAWPALRERGDGPALRWLCDFPNRLAFVLELRLAARARLPILECGLAAARGLGDRRGEGNHLGNLGMAYADLGDGERARKLWQEALAILEAIGSPYAERVRGWLTEPGEPGAGAE